MTALDRARWLALEPLLDHALELSVEEQERWLATLETTAPDDAQELRNLLALDRASDIEQFLEREAPVTSLAGRTVGSYTLVRPLGHGGMGSVWLADRTDGRFEGQAAVKLLNLGLMSARGEERFRREGSALARLNRPGIARLLDAGISAGGQPYLVLEYVDGVRIDAYARTSAPSVEAKIRLILQVLDALSHAHANLIVHRDLKPSNVLVTADGTVKLLDFGIAKLLDETGEGGAMTDHTGAMTPAFAAPEQLKGEPVATTTDVYAAGALLYLLLAGRHPTGADTLSQPEALKAVLEMDPAPLGLGELDLVVAKALQKQPGERYASTAAFADDLSRFLRHEPVSARPLSLGYRTRKFVRRNRVGVVLAAVIAMAISVVTVREYRLRSLAEGESRTARSVVEYLLAVFGTADPFFPHDTTAAGRTARDMLDRGTARLDTVLAAEPQVRSRLRTALGRVYANLGLYDQAGRQLELALSEQRALTGDGTAAGAGILVALGTLRDRQGRIAEADSLLQMALDRYRRLPGSPDSATATALEHLSEVRREQNNFESAEALIREALSIRRALHGDDALPTSMSQQMLAEVLANRGEDSAAAPLYRDALAIRERQVGRDHPLVAKSMFMLALTERRLGRIAVAESLYRRTLDIERRTLGVDHPQVAATMNGLADLLHKAASRSTEAEELLREAIAINRRRLGENNPAVSTNLGNLAVIVRERGDFAEAERLLHQALAIDEATFGPEHSYVAYDLNELATILRLQGKADSATAIFRRVLAMMRKAAGEGHRNTLAVKVQLGRALREDGKFEEASIVFREVLTHVPGDNPDTDPFKVGAITGLARSLVRLGAVDEALPLLQTALASSATRYGATHPRTLEAHLGLGEYFLAMGRRAEARASLDTARALLEPQRQAQPVLSAELESELRRLGRAP
jgi:tetratricopeptide (TPR) repeat protein